MKCWMIMIMIMTAGVCSAGDFLRVFKLPLGNARTVKAVSLGKQTPLAPNEVSRGKDKHNFPRRLPMDYTLPSVAARYYAWDGTNVVEASQAVKDAVDADIAAKAAAAKDALATQDADLAYIKALVKVINLRFAPGDKITGAELKAAIKAEL